MKRLIIVLLALAMLVGNASAYGTNIVSNTNGLELDPSIPLTLGSITPYGISITGMGTATGTLTMSVTSNSPDLVVNQKKNTAPFNGDMVVYDVFDLTLSENAKVGDTYTVTLTTNANGLYNQRVIDLTAVGQQHYEAIPEFPTIALPVAAILGLAFFMQRRKEE
jgi:hypothetical protein